MCKRLAGAAARRRTQRRGWCKERDTLRTAIETPNIVRLEERQRWPNRVADNTEEHLHAVEGRWYRFPTEGDNRIQSRCARIGEQKIETARFAYAAQRLARGEDTTRGVRK